MAERDQLVRALRRHDAGEPRRAEHVALLGVALADQGHGLGRHDDAALGAGGAGGDGLRRRRRPCWRRRSCRDASAASSAVTPNSRRRVAAATSASRIRLSPTRSVRMPAAARRSTSARVKMPLSPTTMRSFGTRGASSSDTASEVSKVRRLRLLMPMSRVPSGSARSSSRGVVHLDEHVHAERLRASATRARASSSVTLAMMTRMQSAPHGARLEHLVGLEEEILAQHRQAGGLAGGGEILGPALERRLVGQHREAGRAALGIGAGERRRIEIGADEALRRARLLDLGDQRRAIGREMALDRGGKAARRWAPRAPARSISRGAIRAFAAAISSRL